MIALGIENLHLVFQRRIILVQTALHSHAAPFAALERQIGLQRRFAVPVAVILPEDKTRLPLVQTVQQQRQIILQRVELDAENIFHIARGNHRHQILPAQRDADVVAPARQLRNEHALGSGRAQLGPRGHALAAGKNAEQHDRENQLRASDQNEIKMVAQEKQQIGDGCHEGLPIWYKYARKTSTGANGGRAGNNMRKC